MAFAEKGHDGVSLHRDVLAPAGVSNGSFYHQFADKTQLLVAVLEEAADAGRFVLAQSTRVGPTDDPVAVAERAFDAWFTMVDGAEDLFRIQLHERDNPDQRVRELVRSIRTSWVATIADRLAGPTAAPGADHERAARLIAALANGVVIEYLATAPEARARTRAELMALLPRFVVGGVAGLELSG